jgi:hypothetical protein
MANSPPGGGPESALGGPVRSSTSSATDAGGLCEIESGPPVV